MNEVQRENQIAQLQEELTALEWDAQQAHNMVTGRVIRKAAESTTSFSLASVREREKAAKARASELDASVHEKRQELMAARYRLLADRLARKAKRYRGFVPAVESIRLDKMGERIMGFPLPHSEDFSGLRQEIIKGQVEALEEKAQEVAVPGPYNPAGRLYREAETLRKELAT